MQWWLLLRGSLTWTNAQPAGPAAQNRRSDVTFDPALSFTGLLVGVLVGLTGVGGGALLTPALVLVFGVPPLAAVSTDLVTSLAMKPIGAVVHVRRGTVHRALVGWLALGAVPAAFLGAILVGRLGRSETVQRHLTVLIGAMLVVSVLASVVRLVLDRRAGGSSVDAALVVRPAVTAGIGVVGGLAVGMTSVGAGSLIIGLLVLAYPRLTAARLVGTDIVAAIPLVGAAALGHLLFGEVQVTVTLALLLGALPGVYLGARLSAQAPTGFVRPIVAAVLSASAAALLQAPTTLVVTGAAIVGLLTAGLASAPTPRVRTGADA